VGFGSSTQTVELTFLVHDLQGKIGTLC
jgi:hypothetical protein